MSSRQRNRVCAEEMAWHESSIKSITAYMAVQAVVQGSGQSSEKGEFRPHNSHIAEGSKVRVVPRKDVLLFGGQPAKI